MTVEEADEPGGFRFFTEIGIIEQLSRTRLERGLPDGLKVSQFAVLNHLVRLGGTWSPKRLAEAFQVTSGAMTNTLNRLEVRGLIDVAEDSHDKRGKLVTITGAGREIRGRCVASVGPFLEELATVVTENELMSALAVLEKVRRHLDAHRG